LGGFGSDLDGESENMASTVGVKVVGISGCNFNMAHGGCSGNIEGNIRGSADENSVESSVMLTDGDTSSVNFNVSRLRIWCGGSGPVTVNSSSEIQRVQDGSTLNILEIFVLEVRSCIGGGCIEGPSEGERGSALGINGVDLDGVSGSRSQRKKDCKVCVDEHRLS